jgi:hypothetical protein
MQQGIERSVARHSIDWDGQSSWGDSALRISVSWVVFEVVAVAISFGFALHLGRTVGFDISNYQFLSGEGQLRGLNSISGLGGQLQTYTDVQMNGLYFLLITHESPRVVVLTIAFLQSLTVSVVASGVFALSLKRGLQLRGAYLLSFVVLAATIAMPNYLSELGGTGSDSLLVLPLAIAFMLLWCLISMKTISWESWVIALVAGLLVGSSMFLKFTNGPWGLGLICGFILAFFVGQSTRLLSVWRKLGYILVLCGSTVLAFCLGYGGEAMFLWRHYRDPFFPYFGKLFHSPDLLPADFRDNRFSVDSLSQAANHFSTFLVGGNGVASYPTRSPLICFGLIAIFVSFLFTVFGDRSVHNPHKLFIQISCLVGFALWMYSFGVYRYITPFEIALPGLLVALGLLHNFRHTAIPICIGVLLAATLFGNIYQNYGHQSINAPSYFGVDQETFAYLKGSDVVFAGPATTGFMVPYFPQGTTTTDLGSNLFQVMSPKWFQMSKEELLKNQKPVVLLTNAQTLNKAVDYFKRIGLEAHLQPCRSIPSDVYMIASCPVTFSSL